MRVTHIRLAVAVINHGITGKFDQTWCGASNGGTISYEHYRERPEHWQSLREPVCTECRRKVAVYRQVRTA